MKIMKEYIKKLEEKIRKLDKEEPVEGNILSKHESNNESVKIENIRLEITDK